MLTDVKKLLETTMIPVGEVCFIKPIKPPYIVFFDNVKVTGSDNVNCIVNRDITVEFYSSKVDIVNEELIENVLNNRLIEFDKSRSWIDSERMFQTVYEFFIIEKNRSV